MTPPTSAAVPTSAVEEKPAETAAESTPADAPAPSGTAAGPDEATDLDHQLKELEVEESDSDSEDDDEGTIEDVKTAYTTSIRRESYEKRSVTPAVRPSSVRPPSSAMSVTSTPNPDMTPSALLEKEAKIKQMRELIKRREQELLQRSAQVCSFTL